MDGYPHHPPERAASPAQRVTTENARAAVVAACDAEHDPGYEGPPVNRPPGLARAIARLSAGVIERGWS